MKETKLKAENKYYREKYVLDADDFEGVTFKPEK
ncbi:MAG: DpnD/PcfM family protein [Clostridia bacterium]|nr:DpnD/PcfM family protein [Clostridia bacterium]